MKSKAKYIIIVGVVLFQSLVAYPLITMAEENDSKSVNIETTLEPKEVESTTSETEMEASTKEVVEEKTSQKSIITNNLTQEKSVLQAGETYESTFPDAALATVIAKAATGSEDITQEVSQTDLNKITSLTATSKGIVDLTGINLLSKLAYLSMSGNQISDISALNGLANLSNLNVSSNQITSFNLNANSNLPMLNTVDIRSNDLNNINVQDQSKLRTIKCDTGSSSELTEVMLKNLPTLIAASNSSNPVADDIAFSSTPGLSKVILENLPSTSSSVQLDRCVIEELVINNLPKVSIVTINNNKITTLEGLEDLATLSSLNAGNNELTEIENMHTFPSLQTLNLSSNALTNMVMNQATAEKFPLLRTMDIRSNNLIKIDIQNQSKLATIICDTGSSSELIEVTLKNLPELIAASNGSNQVKDDIAFLSTPGLSKVILENLPSTSSSVQLDRCVIEELVINNLPKVSIVTINNNKITTLEGLEDLAALTSLNAGNNELTEIENMHTFPSLQTLNLSSNDLTNMVMNQATAEKFPLLRTMDIRSNNLIKIDIQNQSKLATIICDTGSSSELIEVTLKNLPELIAASNGSNQVKDDIAFLSTPGLSKVILENLPSTSSSVQLDRCVIEELVINNLPKVSIVTINNNKITTLEGLEDLAALTSLNAGNNELTEIESMHAFPKLQTLTLISNKLTSIILNQATANGTPNLTSIDSRSNDLTKIDIQDQPKLTKIICDTGSSAELTELTLRNLPELIAASNGSNAVSDDIAFSATPGLSKVTLENLLATNVTIQLDHCVIEELVINNVPQVAFIYINNNKITTLEGLGNLTAVTNLNAENNELTELENIPAFPKLKTLTVNNNHISVLPTSLKTKNPVLTTLSATNQTITLKQKVIVSDLVLDNEVKNFGQTTTAKSISNNGTYQNNQVTWLFEDVQGVNAVDYQFSEPIQEATIQGTFSGKVTQPIKVSTVPVITADTEMTYPKNATISEAAFFKDISASVTDDAILTSDFESVVDFVKAGTYEVTLNAMNEDGVEAVSVTVLVHIAKSPAPVITADKEITYTQSTEVSTTEFLVAIHATTNDGSPIESDLDTTVNWSKVGDYTITLSATNEDGVEAIPVKVAVHIVEPPAPTISNVIFDVDGVQTTESHEVGELVSEPLTPTKEGYTFIGWYDEKTGGNKWDFTTDKMPGYNITLYAQFSKDTNKGEDGDGGKASVASSMEVTPSGQSQSENSKNSSNIKLPATGDDNATVLLVGLGLLMLGLFIRLTQKKHTK